MKTIYLVSYLTSDADSRTDVFATHDESFAKRYVGRANVVHTKRLEVWAYRRDVMAQIAMKEGRLKFPYDITDWSGLTPDERAVFEHCKHLKRKTDKWFFYNPVKFIFGGVVVARKKS